MYERILVPLDGSTFAEHALLEAARVIGDRDAPEVVLLRVVEPQPLPPAAPGAGVPSLDLATLPLELLAEAELDAHEYLARTAERLRDLGFSAIISRVVAGDPAMAISEEAGRLGCELVIIASHCRTGFARALRGSVADFVVNNTPDAAVLVVCPTDGAKLAPLLA